MAHSRHTIELITMPARFWKWRMRGAALHFYNLLPDLSGYAGIITSSLMSLSDFKMLAGPHCPPVLVYFHENQLTYPLAPGESMDLQFGFTDITTGLAANRILFNSKTHLNVFFNALPGFLKRMPEFRPHWVTAEIRGKADTLHPGCHFPAVMPPPVQKKDLSPLIIWNHRWEFDKNPQDFVDALAEVSRKGIDFRLAILGENFQTVPPALSEAKERFKTQLVQYGYVPSREIYHDWLRQGDIVISTAYQENFGISIVEAMRYGCLPLLPNRLAYPEILPKAFHADFLYTDQADLIEKLAGLLMGYDQYLDKREALMKSMAPHAWEKRSAAFDQELTRLAWPVR